LVTRQFEVFQNPAQHSRANAPFVIVLQSHYLDAIDTVVVAPLIRPNLLEPDGVLSLLIDLDGEIFTAAIALLTNMDTKRLSSVVGDLHHYEDDIRRALDRLFTGF